MIAGMMRTATCPDGHRWEVTLDDEVSSPVMMSCPVCGKPCPADQKPTAAANDFRQAVTSADVPPAEASLPDVPGYEVLRLLGQGGMGRVYKARHLGLRRNVALKMISSGWRATGEQLARFRREAQSLARLHHPNIVQIFEIHDCQGYPCFSLELVEGGSLDQKLAGAPQEPRQAARWIETLARAIHLAHEQGIVHRDLKPGNVLVTAEGQLKITDFGLAKCLEEENPQTQTGSLLGTPSYMAPEQAAGDLKATGPLADVYALGAMLYEMLTGHPPFLGLSTMETLHLIRTAEPVPPARVRPGVPIDLQTICLKCLEKVPAKRYASALELADDLARLLANEPIRARPAGAVERLVKWGRRHPARVGMLAVIVGAGVCMSILGIWSYVSLHRAAERDRERLEMARGVVDDLYTKVAEEWLVDQPDKDSLAQEFLEKARALYEAFSQEDSRDPTLRRETALSFFRLGQLSRAVDQHAKAEESYGRAIVLQKKLHDEYPLVAQYQQDLANTYNWLGDFLRENGRPLAEAERYYQQAFDLQDALLDRFPDEPSYRRELARSRYNLGLIKLAVNQLEAAGRHFDEAIQLLTTQKSMTSSDRIELARCYINRGVQRKESRLLKEAKEDYRRAIDLLKALLGEGRARSDLKRDLATASTNLGNVLLELGEHLGARRELDESVVLLQRLVDDFPKRPAYKKKLANTYNSLASVWEADSMPAKVEENWKKAFDLLQQLDQEQPDVADHQLILGMTTGNLGRTCAQRGDWRTARRRFEAAIDHLRRALKSNPKSPDVLRALRDQYQSLSETFLQLGEHALAARSAKALAEVRPDNARDSYFAACFLARCVPLAEKDANLADDHARKSSAHEYVESAIDMLRAAAVKDRSDLKRLPNEQAIFSSLRGDSRLSELLEKLGPAPSQK
jgi:tetratricopeptide (TPR) repeat protein